MSTMPIQRLTSYHTSRSSFLGAHTEESFDVLPYLSFSMLTCYLSLNCRSDGFVIALAIEWTARALVASAFTVFNEVATEVLLP